MSEAAATSKLRSPGKRNRYSKLTSRRHISGLFVLVIVMNSYVLIQVPYVMTDDKRAKGRRFCLFWVVLTLCLGCIRFRGLKVEDSIQIAISTISREL